MNRNNFSVDRKLVHAKKRLVNINHVNCADRFEDIVDQCECEEQKRSF